MIHDKLIDSHKVNSVSFEAEALFVRLITLADDNGNYYGDLLRIFANAVPEKKGATQDSTQKALKELTKIGLLIEYEGDRRQHVHIADFEKHQDLRKDLSAQVEFPLHPSALGPAYTENGERRDKCVRPRTEPERGVTGPNGHETECGLEVEVEVKGKEQVEGSDETSFEPVEPNFYTFQRAFKQAAGIKPKDFVGSVERYKALGRKYGEQEVLDSINDWVERRGGKRVTRKDVWSPKNFLEEAEDILDARLEAKSEPGEGAVMPGPRGVREELMR